ncbi:MAG: DnaJ domain-containing protein [Polyangiales bacterium]
MPELRGDVDVRALPLTALDGFVLSRIDGRSAVADIVAMTGLPGEQVQAILARLVELGVVRFRGEPAPSAPEEARARPSSKPPSRVTAPPPRGPSMAPGSPSSAPRRRHSMPPPRRMMSESPISSPPPELRSTAPRAPSIAPGAERPRSIAPSMTPDARVRPSGPPRSSQRPPAMAGAPAGASSRERIASSRPRSLEPVQIEAQPLYDEHELDEPVDLPRDRRKQILDFYYRLPLLDYYQLLGVPYGAERKQIRSGYFSLSKAFHPDSMFRKELGSFKAKMTAVFEALTEAYETLGKQAKRDEYDAYLRSTRSIADAERALSTDVANDNTQVEVPRAPPLPEIVYDGPVLSPLPPLPPPPPREASPEARRVARELLEKRLNAGRAVRREGEPPPAPPPPAPVDPVVERQSLAKQLTRSLIDAGKVTGTNDKVTRAVVQAKDSFERGDVSGAVEHVARALSFAPERTDLRVEHERLARIVAEQLAKDYAEHARFETKQGKWASAAASWAKVCDGRPEDAEAHRSAAYALMKAGGDLRGAQKYAQQAVFLAPSDVDARILLGQIYLTVGLKLNARRELEAAAKLDPQNEMVKNLFSELKG